MADMTNIPRASTLQRAAEIWYALGGLLAEPFLRHAREKEELEARLREMFPENWRTVLATMAAFDRASLGQPSARVLQMWVRGELRRRDLLTLFDACPQAFGRPPDLRNWIGKPAAEVMPMLAARIDPDFAGKVS